MEECHIEAVPRELEASKGVATFVRKGPWGNGISGMYRSRGMRNLVCSGKTTSLGDDARQRRGTEGEELRQRNKGEEKQSVVRMIFLAFYLSFA